MCGEGCPRDSGDPFEPTRRKTMAISVDPVCGMTVEEAGAAASSRHNDATYYFCSGGCKKAFDAEPAQFLPGDHTQEHDHGGHHEEHHPHHHPGHGEHGEGCCGRCEH